MGDDSPSALQFRDGGSWLQAREPGEAQAAMPPVDQLHNREIEVGSVPAWLLKSAGPQCT